MIEQTADSTVQTLPYKFTAKERDEETGLYYYGARYLDPRTSRWLSTDPALGDYIPQAPVNDETKKANQNLPGMGGVYNTVNMHLYHYAGNNPVKYTDPDGREIKNSGTILMSSADDTVKLGPEGSKETVNSVGCVLTAYTRIASAISGKDITLADANQKAVGMELYTNTNELTPEAGAQLITALVGDSNISASYAGSVGGDSATGVLQILGMNSSELYVTGRMNTTGSDGNNTYGHTVNINSGAVVSDKNAPGNMNIRVSDTSGVRSQVHNDVRTNTLERIDVFNVTRTLQEL